MIVRHSDEGNLWLDDERPERGLFSARAGMTAGQVAAEWSAAELGPSAQDAALATVLAIKAECRRRIIVMMTEDQQRNTLAAGQAATMQYGADPANWPSEQQERHEAAMTAWAEIERLRARSNQIEAMDPLPGDICADDLWLEPTTE